MAPPVIEPLMAPAITSGVPVLPGKVNEVSLMPMVSVAGFAAPLFRAPTKLICTAPLVAEPGEFEALAVME